MSLFPLAKTHYLKKKNQTPNSHFGELQNELPLPFLCVFVSFNDHQKLTKMSSPTFPLCFFLFCWPLKVEHNELPLPFLCVFLFFIDNQKLNKMSFPNFLLYLSPFFWGSCT
jgi:hypothetical protein